MSPWTSGRGWAYAGALLGGAVSVAANVAHSYVPPAGAPAGWAPQGGAVLGAVFWPLALFVAIEILARTGWPVGLRWVLLRFGGLLPVAVVAAVVSYRHLSGLLAFYGEDALTATIGPLAVDGLMVMATGALIATGARRTPASQVGVLSAGPGEAAPIDTDKTPAAVVSTADDFETGPDAGADIGAGSAADTHRTPARTRPRTRRTAKADTATAVARLRQRHPDMSSADIARRLGVTDRTVRRHLSTPATPELSATPVAA